MRSQVRWAGSRRTRARSRVMSKGSREISWTSGRGRLGVCRERVQPLRMVRVPRFTAAGAGEVVSEPLAEPLRQDPLVDGPRVVAVLMVADGREDLEPVPTEPLQPLRVVGGRGPVQRALLLGHGADRPEVAGALEVAAPAAVDEVAGHQHAVGVGRLPVIEHLAERAAVLIVDAVERAPGVPEARPAGQVADIGVEEIGARQKSQSAGRGGRRLVDLDGGQLDLARVARAEPDRAAQLVSGGGDGDRGESDRADRTALREHAAEPGVAVDDQRPGPDDGALPAGGRQRREPGMAERDGDGGVVGGGHHHLAGEAAGERCVRARRPRGRQLGGRRGGGRSGVRARARQRRQHEAERKRERGEAAHVGPS